MNTTHSSKSSSGKSNSSLDTIQKAWINGQQKISAVHFVMPDFDMTLSTEPATLPASVETEEVFTIRLFVGDDKVELILRLKLNEEGNTQIAAAQRGWIAMDADNNYQFIGDGGDVPGDTFELYIQLQAEDPTAGLDIIIVGTVPTLPGDDEEN
jgi:hypothetical protein